MDKSLKQTHTQNVKQIQRLILSPQMQQALYLLQLPILELSSVIQEELTQNPVLELDSDNPEESFEILRQIDDELRLKSPSGKREDEDLKAFIENTLAYESSLFDHLIVQAKETFFEEEKLKLAEWIIGNLDSDGLLRISLEEIAAFTGKTLETILSVLREIQTFDPVGVGAQSLQEALLIQLKAHGKENSLAFRIIANHYEDVVHNRILAISKALSRPSSEIYETITEEIAHLDLHPGSNEPLGHYRQVVQSVIPDVTIQFLEGKFSISISDEKLPSLRLNQYYLSMLEQESLPLEARAYIQEKIASSKWLLRNLHERHQTLYRIAEELIQTQKDFFSAPMGNLNPLTMKEIALKLQLHESTIARAVSNKYLFCPRGIYPLRSFFTNAYTTEDGENISSQTVKDLLKEILAKEDRKQPFSDEALSHLIKERGIPCARRTVAKYRQELGIGNTVQRKIH